MFQARCHKKLLDLDYNGVAGEEIITVEMVILLVLSIVSLGDQNSLRHAPVSLIGY